MSVPQKYVRVRLTLEFEMAFDADWGKDAVEYYLNEKQQSSHAMLPRLTDLLEDADEEQLCACSGYEYLGNGEKLLWTDGNYPSERLPPLPPETDE